MDGGKLRDESESHVRFTLLSVDKQQKLDHRLFLITISPGLLGAKR